MIKEPLQILSFDPGPHCGLAWRNPDDTLDARMIYNDLHETFKFITSNPHPKVVVFEDFQTAGNISKDGLYTVRLIGGIQALCLIYNVPAVQMLEGVLVHPFHGLPTYGLTCVEP